MIERAQSQRDFEVKRLARPFSVKAVDDAQGTIEGHGAVFGNLHPTSAWSLPSDWQDRIQPGAFAKTLAEHKSAGTMPAMLYMHERGNVIGSWSEMKEDEDGLLVKGQVAMTARAPSGASLYELVKMAALNAMSIGFRPIRIELDEKKKIRDLHEVALGELSIVDIPGNGLARITDVKSADPARLKRRIEEALRDAGLSREESKAFIADGFKALRDAAPEESESPFRRDAGASSAEKAVESLIAHMRASRAR